jgi:hypothetical protein
MLTILCVYLESDQGPLSYQDSVLPLNYTRLRSSLRFELRRAKHAL